MPAPLAFRASARSLANSPMSGTRYSWLLLGDGDGAEEVRVRAPVQRLEAVEEMEGKLRVTVKHWIVVREDVVAATLAKVIRTSGDRFRDDEGTLWGVVNAFRTGGALWRCDLEKPQDVPATAAARPARPRRGG